MPLTTVEKQRRYRERMYEAGYKPSTQWIKREGQQRGKIEIKTFAKKMEKLTTDWDEIRLSKHLHLLLSITEAKKEVYQAKEE